MELRIKEVLKEKGLTAVWLASQIEITQPSMSGIMNGKIKPSLDTLERIASAIGVSISELFEQPATDIIVCPKCGTKFKME